MNFRCSAVTGEIFAKHDMNGHYERKARLIDAVLGIPDGVEIISPRPATISDLERVHTRDYIRMIRDLCSGEEKRYIDMNTYLTADTFEVASFAAGCSDAGCGKGRAWRTLFRTCQAARDTMPNPIRAMGFCIFNNVAVAAAYAVASGRKSSNHRLGCSSR